MNTLTSKNKILANLVLKKKSIILFLFLFLSLLVNDCILMYLETTVLCIYNFLMLYGCLFGGFFFFFFLIFFLHTPAFTNLKF